MGERRFTRGLGRLGLAAQLREDVSLAVKATASQARSLLPDPVEYEEYISNNKVLINNDPLRELLLYPVDDLIYAVCNRESRTLHSFASLLLEEDISNALVKQCLVTYSQSLTTITYKYLRYSGSYLHLPRLPKVEDLKEQVYEIDTDIEQRDLAILSNGENILKKGYLLKAPDGGNEKIFGNFSAKTFKRRFACLRQEVDGTYLFEFHKDERKNDSKGVLVMELCTNISKNPRRGRCCFELTFSEGCKSVLSAESEADLEDWMDKLTRVIHADRPQDELRSDKAPHSNSYGTLRGLEHSLNPQLIKYAHETDFSIAQARQEDRYQVFTCCSTLPKQECESDSLVELIDDSLVMPYKEEFGSRLHVACHSIKFRLQAPIDSNDGPLAQIEPYFASLALYDRAKGCKISEEFRFDLNNSFNRNLLPKVKKCEESFSHDLPLSALQLAGVPEEWLAFPKQAVMNVQRPHSDIFLVVKIEKVLQGSINQTIEPYIKSSDAKLVQKLQKNVKSCCQRLGEFRMPFGWCARPIFRYNGEVNLNAEFSPIYKCDEKKNSEAELLKLLNDFTKTEKMSKLTIIPGSVSIDVSNSTNTLPNSVTSALEPVKPFPNPPTHEPTLEIQEFLGQNTDFIHPFTHYSNHLFVYPMFLNYENQKTFNRARNIVCKIELRDSDAEDARPLKVIYGPPGHSGSFVSSAYSSVLHHNTFPEWSDEIKIALPPNLSPSHHILFTFSHVSVEAAKAGKKEEPVETVGYSWHVLFNKGRISTEEQLLPVAAHLPGKYLSIEPLGLGKGFSGPEIRWVDSQRSMFKVQMRLISTVFSCDQHLTNFFQSTSSLVSSDGLPNSSHVSLPKTSLPNGIEIVKCLKALLALEIQTIIRFLPTLLNQLFLVLLCEVSDVAVNVTRVLVHITHEIHEAGKEDILHSYIKFVQSVGAHGKKTVHGELCQSLTVLLQSSNLDSITSHKILRHLQVFFSFVARSMAIHLLTTERIKMTRNERFNDDYEEAVKSLISLVSYNIVHKYKETPIEARAANKALAHFLKHCLSMMNRGYVFGLIKLYLSFFNPGDSVTLHSLKFTFLRIVCSHEHFICLNLPIFSFLSSSNGKERLRGGADEFYLSSEFISRHFLVGALLSELRSALGEVADVQRISINVLRDLLAKHAFDDRYLQVSQQGRIGLLYFPVISILMENVSRLNWPSYKKTFGSVGASLRKGSEIRGSGRSKTSSRPRGSLDLSLNSTPPTTLLRSSIRTDPGRGESSYLSIIAGPGVQTGAYTSPQPLSPSPLVPGRSNTSLESVDRPPSVANSDLPEEDEIDDASSVAKSHTRSISVAFTGECGPVRYDKLSASEAKNLLLCLLHVLKHVPNDYLASWWMTLSRESLMNFFTLLTLSLHYFKYNGKRQIVREQVPKKASTLPTKLQPPFFPYNRASMHADNGTIGNHDCEGWTRALQEANLATEVGLIVLDVLCNFSTHCAELLQGEDCEEILRRVFDIQMLFLQLGQSETLMKHVFAALRAFINNFPSTLFLGDASICGSLCFEMLKYCNSKLSNMRHEACAVLYLLMRGNYEFTQRSGINRVHLQVIISVSELLGEVIGLNNSRFQESMALINNYATSDKAMTNTGFVSEVRDLTKRIRTVLVATAQMREHERDPEMLCDLQHSLAASYAATPELRRTWLQAMVKHHVKNGDLSEAALCLLHIAALIAEYLKHQNEYREGCVIFDILSPNISADESCLRLDAESPTGSVDVLGEKKAGSVDTVFTIESLVSQLEVAADMVERAERYELLGNLYRILIPIYEEQRNYSALVSCYSHLFRAYSRVVEVNASQKRLLGRYYRVAFYGATYFDEEAGQAYVYKEPKVTSLAEISERLHRQFCDKFGKETVKMIMDSNFVASEELDSRFAFIQVTHVEPFFSEEERLNRLSEFERNHNIRTFVFETPFTKEGRAHGKLEEQWKRRVHVVTAFSFPYVKKRIRIIETEVQEMSPLQVAIDEMESRVKELKEITNKKPTDVKKLQLKLQGSISVQVNAGPLAYASAFLEESHSSSYPANQITKLKDVYREFMMTSKQALDLNSRLINSDQYEYQMALETNFSELLSSLSNILREPLLVAQVQVDSMLKRSSQHYLSLISSPRGANIV